MYVTKLAICALAETLVACFCSWFVGTVKSSGVESFEVSRDLYIFIQRRSDPFDKIGIFRNVLSIVEAPVRDIKIISMNSYLRVGMDYPTTPKLASTMTHSSHLGGRNVNDRELMAFALSNDKTLP